MHDDKSGIVFRFIEKVVGTEFAEIVCIGLAIFGIIILYKIINYASSL